MTARSSLNLKFKNSAEIDNAINSLTKNIQDTFNIFFITWPTQDSCKNYITLEIRELIL